MKKMMFALAVAISAICSQAAIINWSVQGVAAPTGETLANGWVAYFIDQASQPANMASMTAADWVSFVDGNSYSAGELKTGRSSAYNVVAAGAPEISPETSYTGYIVMFDAADVADANYYNVTSPTTKKSAASGNLTWSEAYASASGWKAIATTTPEPTSGLLLLIGFAGLALRRRRI